MTANRPNVTTMTVHISRAVSNCFAALRAFYNEGREEVHYLEHINCVTFGRLAVSDFELGMNVIVYLFTVMFGFAFWSILDVRFWNFCEVAGYMTVYLAVSALVYSGLEVSRCQRSI